MSTFFRTTQEQIYQFELMDFNETIKKIFSKLLFELGFLIIEDSQTEVSFKSDKVTIRFIYSPYEYDYYYFIKLNNEEKEYENFLVERFLKFKQLQRFFSKFFRRTTADRWATQRLICLVKFQDTLLKGDKGFYLQLANYSKEADRRYNKKFT